MYQLIATCLKSRRGCGAASKVANSSIAESKLLSIIYQIFIRDENIKIFFRGAEDEWVCEYTIKGGKLTVYGNLWGDYDDYDFFVFTRK